MEGTRASQNDPYLAQFPQFIKDRALVGVRYQFYRNMALKLELSKEHMMNDRYNQLPLRWTAVFP
jgi:hypothetical protein